MITKADAVARLRPDTEWVMRGEDVVNIEWITPNTEPLTELEVQDEMLRLKDVSINIRSSAIAHAKSLGFTDEMISIMYPKLVSQI